MIWAFTGKTGSGKTFHMVSLAYQQWKDGRDIYSNTILFFDKMNKGYTIWERLKAFLFRYELCRGRIIYFEEISEILEVHDGLILFDEAQVLFNARQWESLPAEFQYKLQQHRKHQLDLYCTTQNMGAIDITYRRLVQIWIHHDNIFQMGNVWFGIFMKKWKDVDRLYNSVDDLMVEDVKTKLFFIGFWSKRLYDTFYDIGFKRLRKIWATNRDTQKKKLYLVNKQMDLKSVQSALFTLQSALKEQKSMVLKRS